MRPQRVRIIGSSSGWVTLKKPLSETSMTRDHCSRRMPGITASSWMPALLTTIWIAPASSSCSSARRRGRASVTSKAIASADPPAAVISAASCSARARRRHWHAHRHDGPPAASFRAIAAPIAPLPPVTSARLMPASASSTTAARPLSKSRSPQPSAEMIDHAPLVADKRLASTTSSSFAEQVEPLHGGRPRRAGWRGSRRAGRRSMPPASRPCTAMAWAANSMPQTACEPAAAAQRIIRRPVTAATGSGSTSASQCTDTRSSRAHGAGMRDQRGDLASRSIIMPATAARD